MDLKSVVSTFCPCLNGFHANDHIEKLKSPDIAGAEFWTKTGSKKECREAGCQEDKAHQG